MIMMNQPGLEYIFHPRSIAVAGLSPDPYGTWLNQVYLDSPLKMGFKGPIYPINPKGGHIGRLPVYASLKDVPGPVDYVISCIPARHTPKLMEDCRDAGVKVMQLYTAGFAETGEPQGIDLQKRLLEIARSSGIRIIGPNCMGIYCPDSGINFSMDFPRESGPLGLLCQSGGNTAFIIRSAVVRGLRFSKAISYGNACDINECDLLEYLADDPNTRVIAAYIEGTTDGRRLVRTLTKAASKKPVVVFKGGYTEGGGRATASHTGSLAGTDSVWEGLLKQTGAIRVYSVEEMADVLVALLRMKPPQGLNACAVGIGGGASVLATDELERAGLKLPSIPAVTENRMKELIPLAGGMLCNPIDAFPLVGVLLNRSLVEQPAPAGEESPVAAAAVGDRGWGDFLKAIEDWQGLDLVIFHFAFDTPPIPAGDWVAATVEPTLAAVMDCKLPMAVVFHSMATNASWQVSWKIQELCLKERIPFFLTLRGAAQAIRKLIEFNKAYPEKLARLQEPGQ